MRAPSAIVTDLLGKFACCASEFDKAAALNLSVVSSVQTFGITLT